jgi:hypothetical protein
MAGFSSLQESFGNNQGEKILMTILQQNELQGLDSGSKSTNSLPRKVLSVNN